MENESVTVVARIRAKPGMEDLVKLILLQLVGETREEDGCVNYILHQSTMDPDLFLFYETWKNRDLLERHSESAHLLAFQRKSADLLAEPTEITLWERIS